MRFVLLTAIIFATGIFGLCAVSAYEAPWCAVVAVGSGTVTWDCHYQTFEECAPNVIAGNRGFCNRNPRWPGYYQDYTAYPKHHKKHHSEGHQ